MITETTLNETDEQPINLDPIGEYQDKIINREETLLEDWQAEDSLNYANYANFNESFEYSEDDEAYV